MAFRITHGISALSFRSFALLDIFNQYVQKEKKAQSCGDEQRSNQIKGYLHFAE